MKTALALLLSLLVSLPAAALTVEGKDYPDTMSQAGKALKLIGAGVRKKFGLAKVYAMGAYSESGACDPGAIVRNDEVKAMRLDFLRNVDADTMAKTFGESFEEHMPKDASPELKAQRQQFLSYFKEKLTEGTVLEFVYVPGTGTSLTQNGRSLGAPLPGLAFMNVLWDIYFGKDTCCSGLKEGILKRCGK
jgi:hypothetical protein